MSWTSHDNLLGWVHGFKFNRNNYILGGKTGLNDKPYHVIVNSPSFLQVVTDIYRKKRQKQQEAAGTAGPAAVAASSGGTVDVNIKTDATKKQQCC